jgi:NNP family nitrate/nitrite transporter-like MFS transporter
MELHPPPTATTRSGHWPTLVASFLHFDLSFMLWVLLGALGIYIAEEAGLNAGEKGLMVAVPVLSGSLLRIPLGILNDRVGGRRLGIAMLGFLYLPLTLGWLMGSRLPALLAIGLMLGVAGGSFAVALPLASRWYPPQRQGIVMGIAAAGNSGTVIANLAAPKLADAVGWHNVLALAMVPLTIVLVIFIAMARDSARSATVPSLRQHLGILRAADLWWFCLLYSVTFGGYVGLSSFLPLFYRDQYGLSPVDAGLLTAAAAFVGSGIRPVGGYLADRTGGVRLLSVLLAAIAVCYLGAAQVPDVATMGALLVVGMACFGMGNGAVFQLVPQRFAQQIGTATGMVGALGGVGGFLLPVLLGGVKQGTGGFAPGFLLLALAATTAFVVLRMLVAARPGWAASWRNVQPVAVGAPLGEAVGVPAGAAVPAQRFSR